MGDEKPRPVVAKVKEVVKDGDKPFTLVVILKAKEDVGGKIETAFAKAVKPTRKEKGCLAYDLNRDPKTPGRYVVYERWQNLAALQAHLESEHIKTLLKELGEVLDGGPELRILLPADR